MKLSEWVAQYGIIPTSPAINGVVSLTISVDDAPKYEELSRLSDYRAEAARRTDDRKSVVVFLTPRVEIDLRTGKRKKITITSDISLTHDGERLETRTIFTCGEYFGLNIQDAIDHAVACGDCGYQTEVVLDGVIRGNLFQLKVLPKEPHIGKLGE